MTKRIITFTLLTAGIAVGLTAPGTAEAKFSRHSVHMCTTSSPFSPGASGTLNNTGNNIQMRCAINDDTSYNKTEIDGINVHVYDGPGSASVYARVCETWWGVLGGTCGGWSASPSNYTGNYTISPSLAALDADGDFPFLQIQLPASARLKGFYTWG